MARLRPPATRMASTSIIANILLASIVLASSFSFTSAFAFAPSFRSGNWVQHHNAAARRHTAAAAATAAGAGGRTGTPATMVAADPVAGLLKTVTVELEDRSYPIYIGEGILDRCVRLNCPRAPMGTAHTHTHDAVGAVAAVAVAHEELSPRLCRSSPSWKPKTFVPHLSCARLKRKGGS